jgi:type I restriction enzyme, R subunit
MTRSSFVESDVEEAALEWFSELGYDRFYGPDIAPDSKNTERENYSSPILIKKLKSSLIEINPQVPNEAIEFAIRKLVTPKTQNLLENNHNFHKMVIDGIDVEYSSNGEIHYDKVWPIDFKNGKNEFQVVNQFTIKENRQRRPDIIVFVNGLPIGIIELKNPGDENATTKGAFTQVQSTYKKDIPGIFLHNEIIIISDGVKGLIGTTFTDWDRFSPWKILQDNVIVPNTIPELEVIIKGMFGKSRLLDLIQKFITFESTKKGLVKKISGYHQYRAVNKAIEQTLDASSPNGDRKIGVIWHSTGSGKSLTMIFYSSILVQHDDMTNPTIVVITDRNDLDNQLFESFFKNREILRQEPEQADKRTDLQKLLQVASGGIIFTTIQKFMPEKGNQAPLLSDRKNIVVIADEAHRSQYDFIDGFARHVHDSLPNASFIGFTATPIETGDKNTRAVFGEYVDQYDMMQSVEDGFTVPIHYETRHSKLEIDPSIKESIDREFNFITERQEEDERKKAQSKWARLDAIIGSEKNVEQIAKDIVFHFENRLSALSGKGMIVCMSRRMCVALYDEIVKLKPEWHDADYKKGGIKVIMTGSASDPEEFQPHLTTKSKRDEIKDRVIDADDPLKLVIVRDMWLTGFDAPVLHTLYIAKPMHSHALIQAISRVNRVSGTKPAGLIVDYISIGFDIKKALDQYTKAGKEKISLPIEEAVELLENKYQKVKAFLGGFDYSGYFSGKSSDKLRIIVGSMAHIVEQENGKKRFSLAVNALSRTMALCGSDQKAILKRNDIEFFETIRASFAKNTGTRGVDVDVIDSKIQKLVSKVIAPIGVVDLLKNTGITKSLEISILSDEFLQEVKGLKYKNLAIELLSKLLKDEIKVYSKTNSSQARAFSDMLEKSLMKYENRTLQSANIIMELIELSKRIRDSKKRGEKLNLNSDELAFYDALNANDSVIKVLGDENLCRIARETVETIKKNATIDWTIKETSRAKLQSLVKRVLTKNGFPEDKKEETIENIIHQAELISWM